MLNFFVIGSELHEENMSKMDQKQKLKVDKKLIIITANPFRIFIVKTSHDRIR